MEFNILKNSEVQTENRTYRIDAEFFKQESIEAVNIVEKCHYSYIDDVTSWVTQGPNPIFTEIGIPCLNGRNINKGEVIYSNSDYIDEEEYNKLSQYQLKIGDTLITLKGKGSIGKIGYVTDKQRSIFSRDIGIVRPSKINSGYLNIFILCKYGKSLVDRGETGGTGQSTLTTSYLKSIPVPRFSIENQIGEILERVEQLRRESRIRYDQAESFLFSELDLTGWQSKHRLTFVKNYSDTDQVGRMDSEYFQPKYEEIVNAIRNYPDGWDTLGSLCELVGHPSNPPYIDTKDVDRTFIVTQKHLGDFFLNDEFWNDPDALYTTQNFMDKNNQYMLKKGDVLLYSVGAYIGKANIYMENIKSTIGSFLTLLRTKKEKLNQCYLMTFLNTNIGTAISKQHQRGMAQQYLYPYDIRTFPIPLLTEEKQISIQQKVYDSYELQKQSKYLLECAKRAVEIAIEQDEQTALEWLEHESQAALKSRRGEHS